MLLNCTRSDFPIRDENVCHGTESVILGRSSLDFIDVSGSKALPEPSKLQRAIR